MRKIIIIIIIAFNTLGCSTSSEKIIDNINLEGSKWSVSKLLGSVYGIYTLNDLLVVHNVMGDTELTLFETNTKSQILNFAHRGRGHGEVFNSKPIFVFENVVNVYVNGKRTVVSFDLSDLENLKISEKKIGDNADRYISMCMLSDSTYLATGIFTSKKRFSIFDNMDVRYRGNYPENRLIDKSMPFNIVGSAYKSLLSNQPSKNKFAAANIYGKKLHLYNIVDNNIDELCVMGKEEPHFVIRNIGGSLNFGADEKTIWGYINLVSDNDNIYAHYSGRPQIARTPYLQSNFIEVYDWNGELQYTITLDRDVSHIAVVKKVIYAIVDTPENGYDIVEYKLPTI